MIHNEHYTLHGRPAYRWGQVIGHNVTPHIITRHRSIQRYQFHACCLVFGLPKHIKSLEACERVTDLSQKLVVNAQALPKVKYFLISNFRRVLDVVCFVLGNSPAPESYMPTFRNTLSHLHRRVGMNILTSTIPWLTPTRGLSPSRTRPCPPCGSLPSTTSFCTRTRHYPVTNLLIGSGYFSSQTFSHVDTPTFSSLIILHTYLSMKIGQTGCSETSAHKIQTPGNCPEESIKL